MLEPKFIQNITGFTLFVPSIVDTVRWYKKHLGFECDCTEEQCEKWEHTMIKIPDTEYLFHLLQDKNKITGANASCFVFVGGIVAMRDKIMNTGCDKISEIRDEGWGAKLFTVIDLNGFELRICEWNCENTETAS